MFDFLTMTELLELYFAKVLIVKVYLVTSYHTNA